MYYQKTEKLLDSTENNIKKLFFQVFPDLDKSEFNWEKKQNEYENWDSFSHLHLITMIEEKFKITITDDDAINLHSAKDLLDFVERNG
tara:strand:+ start:943 stop:1206 length:264 start_codon:yes stop_codon:yes gene_type:complete